MDKQDIISKAIDFIISFFNKEVAKPVAPIQVKIDAPVVSVHTDPLPISWHEVDWNDPHCKVSKYFTVKEALWLPSWNRMANASDGLDDNVKANLINIFIKMDIVREFLGKPIRVHCAYRPDAYNALVKGAKNSSHKALDDCAAVDWDCNEPCDDTRAKLLPKLEELRLRMEDNGPGAPWVHLDDRTPPPGHPFYFKP